ARRAADRTLVDADHLVVVLETDHLAEGRWLRRAAVERARGRVVERVVDQRRLARTRDAGHANEQSDRQIERDLAQVVAGGAGDRENACGIGAQPVRRHRNLAMAREILAGQRMRRETDLLRRTLRDDLAA